MNIKKFGLAWITVKDLKTAVKYYTDVVGLRVMNQSDEYGWAELSGYEEGSAVLGLAQKNDFDNMQPGSNAVVTFTVDDIEKAKTDLANKGATILGDIMEVPGHVKLLSVNDKDGNRLQIVQKLD